MQAVMDAVEARKELAKEREEEMRSQIGFVGLGELWKKAMIAGQQARFGTAPETSALTAKDVSSPSLLRAILKEFKEAKRDAADVKRLVEAALTTYG